MKKIIIFFLLLFVFASLFKVHAQTTEQIKSYEDRITINKNGTVDVKETIIYDFGDLEKHGIYRNIPYIKTNQDGKQFQLGYGNFLVTDENGQPYNFTTSNIGNDVQLKIGNANETITGVHTYVIDYEVSGALTYFSDHDELYWNVTGNQWEVPIEMATAKIVLPENLQLNQVRNACYTGVSGSTQIDCTATYENGVADIKANNSLNSQEGLTVVVGFPKNVVAVLEPKAYVSFSDTFLGKLVGLLMILVALLWYLVLPIYIIYKWLRHGRDPVSTVGVTSAWFDPPKSFDKKRFLTPGEVGTLGDETVDMKDITATIVDLARRGYIKIEERAKGDFYLVKKNPKKGDKLISFEQLLIDKFFKSDKEIRLKDTELFVEVEEIKKALYEDTVTENLFPKNPQSIRTKYYILTGIALFTGNIGLAVVSFVFGRVMPKKTQYGSDSKNVSHSLKNFLTSQQRQLEFQADKQMMFERLLPYAIAFGVEKIWAKRFQNIDMKPPSWYQGYNAGTFNTFIFVNSLNSSMKSFAKAATPTRSSSGFSSGFSGGFSGGGGGGGGGGSW